MSENQVNNYDPLETGSPEEDRKPMGHIQRIIKVFTSPGEAFEDISRHPKILIPAIIIIVVMTLVTLLNFDQMVEAVRQQTLAQSQMLGTDIPADGFSSIARASAIGSLAFVGIGVVIAALIRAFVTWAIGTFFSSEGSIKKLFSVTLYAAMISTVGSALAELIKFLLGISTFSFSPAMFVGQLEVSQSLSVLLASINLFSIWYWIALSIGVSKVEKISFVKSLLIVVIPSILMIVLSVFISGMAQSLIGL